MTVPLEFETIRNFRDAGGYAAAEGKRMRKGRVYRSAHFPDASEADLEKLRALGIATIVDLRRDTEREAYPCRFWPEFDVRVVTRSIDAGAELPPHLAAFQNAGKSIEAAEQAMYAIYREMPYDPMLIALYQDFFEALASGDGPVLVHCAAGKDRTGLIVALTHHIAGISAEDRMSDYLLTNQSCLADGAAMEKWRETFGRGGRLVDDDAIRAVLSVIPGYLLSAFAAIGERSGGLDGYIHDMLGVDGAMQAAIVGNLVAPAN